MILLASFTPTTITVFAATTDTITVTFDPQGNVSIDVSPDTYNFTQVWAYQNDSTSEHYFTVWNNGTINNMITEIRTTSNSPGDLAVDSNSVPDGDNEYALKVIQGSVSDAPWVAESTYRQLDSDIDASASDDFGLNLYLSNITANHSWQTLVVTLRGTSS